jgi:colanic acid biosynthesis glycosyl transferase WcaI
MALRLESKGIARDRITVIPNWADTSKIIPQPRNNAFARSHGLGEGFVVQYSGNLGLSQGLDTVLSTAKMLREQPITWLFIGDGNARSGLERAARDAGLLKVKFLPPQERAHLSEVLSACDVGLVPMRRSVANDLVPSKLYGIMAAGRPVLASVERDSEVARVVDKARCGWVVDPESPEALAAGVLSAMRMGHAQRQALGQNGRSACLADYSRANVTKKYDRVLRAAAPQKLQLHRDSDPRLTTAEGP